MKDSNQSLDHKLEQLETLVKDLHTELREVGWAAEHKLRQQSEELLDKLAQWKAARQR